MSIIRVALQVNCHANIDRKRCADGREGGTPTPGACGNCTQRRPIDDGPAVTWVDCESVCQGDRSKWSAEGWRMLQAGKLAQRGRKMIVPLSVAAAAANAIGDE